MPTDHNALFMAAALAKPWDGIIHWDSKNVDAHRRGINDITWATMQPKGPPKYVLGDIVEFKVGGYGIITKVSKPHNGWPSEYSADEVPGLRFHAKGINAWHYEGDIKRLYRKSAIRATRRTK